MDSALANSPSCDNHLTDSGHTSWMLVSTALITLMVLPGLVLFYGGLSPLKNQLSAITQGFVIVCWVSLLWFSVGYSLAFGSEPNPVFGGHSRMWLVGWSIQGNTTVTGQMTPWSKHRLNCYVPESVFVVFQGAFAFVSAAILYGAWAERLKLYNMIIFISLWHVFVYTPIARMHWNDNGFLNRLGALDYAGGDVVHVTAGVSGLATAITLGPRRSVRKSEPTRGQNVPFVLVGSFLLWVGWFGFNAGSANAANSRAGFAFLTTQICASAGAMVWLLMDSIRYRWKPHPISIACGAVAGLVVITPACGYVDQTGAFIMGLLGPLACYVALALLKGSHFCDDAGDTFAIHGVGGLSGSLLTGLFANEAITGVSSASGAFYGRGIQFAYQLCGVVVVSAWSSIVTALILVVMQLTYWKLGLKLVASDEDQAFGLDFAEHREGTMEYLQHRSSQQHPTASLDDDGPAVVEEGLAPEPAEAQKGAAAMAGAPPRPTAGVAALAYPKV